MNRVIRYLLGADVLFLGGWGLIDPIFAVFILEEIGETTVFTIGAVSALYWIIKSVAQVPISMYLDKRIGEKDDFYALIFGFALAGFSAMAFLLVDTVFGLFVVQSLHAVSMAFFTPAWSGMYSRHLDENRDAFDWSMNSTMIGFSYAGTALVGGGIAVIFGFEAAFILVSIFSFAAAFLMFSIPHLIFPKTSTDADRTALPDYTIFTNGK